jgi:hypothetical protein
MSSILNQYTFFNKKFNFEGEELSELLKKENERLVTLLEVHEEIKKRLIFSMSNLIEEVSNKKAIVERKKGIMSPYNSLAYNMENEYQS